MKSAWLFLLLLTRCYSQGLSFGVKAGIPLTDAYTNFPVADGGSGHKIDRYTIGPTVEVHLPVHLSFEAEALYRHSSFYVNGGALGNIPNGTFSVNDWQVPLLVKYEFHLPLGLIAPFADGGLVYRHVSHNASYPPTNPSSAGVALGGGITLKVIHLRLSPEIRYTHWGQDAFSPNNGFVGSNSNQVDLLVGFTL